MRALLLHIYVYTFLVFFFFPRPKESNNWTVSSRNDRLPVHARVCVYTLKILCSTYTKSAPRPALRLFPLAEIFVYNLHARYSFRLFFFSTPCTSETRRPLQSPPYSSSSPPPAVPLLFESRYRFHTRDSPLRFVSDSLPIGRPCVCVCVCIRLRACLQLDLLYSFFLECVCT